MTCKIHVDRFVVESSNVTNYYISSRLASIYRMQMNILCMWVKLKRKFDCDKILHFVEKHYILW